MSNIINLVHIVIFFPILFYIYKNRDRLSKEIKLALIVISVIGILYHIYELLEGKRIWVYLIHILYVFPLLFYIGYSENLPRYNFEILLLIAFGMLGYHSYNLINYGILNSE